MRHEPPHQHGVLPVEHGGEAQGGGGLGHLVQLGSLKQQLLSNSYLQASKIEYLEIPIKNHKENNLRW